jgi:hypothetical protein
VKALTPRCSESSGESLHSLHEASCNLLRQELKQIGFDLRRHDLDRLYPHYLSHHIGLGVSYRIYDVDPPFNDDSISDLHESAYGSRNQP